MVSYQAFVSLVYDETPDGSIGDAAENSQFMASIGDYWSMNKSELQTLTEAEARQQIREDLNA